MNILVVDRFLRTCIKNALVSGRKRVQSDHRRSIEIFARAGFRVLDA